MIRPDMSRRLRHVFYSAFTAMDIAEALACFGEEEESMAVSQVMKSNRWSVASVRRRGRPVGYVQVGDLHSGQLGNRMRAFDPRAVLVREASLSDAVAVLAGQPYAFISVLGEVQAVVTRHDYQKPPGRMWLFGMITMLEMNILTTLRLLFPAGEWKERVPAGRLARAEELLQERQRRGQDCDLLDCLQFSDKAQVLLKDEEIRTRLGFVSAKEAKRTAKALESLRNNLAHSQDIVRHDWDSIVQLSAALDGLIEARGLRKLLGEKSD